MTAEDTKAYAAIMALRPSGDERVREAPALASILEKTDIDPSALGVQTKDYEKPIPKHGEDPFGRTLAIGDIGVGERDITADTPRPATRLELEQGSSAVKTEESSPEVKKEKTRRTRGRASPVDFDKLREEIGDAAAQDILDDDAEGTFSGMLKGSPVSPRIRALQDFKEKLREGAAENKAARLKKKKGPTRPTDPVVAGAESVPGGSGVDKGTKISKEEEE